MEKKITKTKRDYLASVSSEALGLDRVQGCILQHSEMFLDQWQKAIRPIKPQKMVNAGDLILHTA